MNPPVVIIGSGPAGYTAAIYSARAGFPATLFTGPQVGGQLVQTTEVENFPGFDEPIWGCDLVERMRKQAVRFGTTLLNEGVVAVEGQKPPFRIQGEKTALEARALIIATGSKARWLQVPGEEEFRGFGVSGCATCDGFFFRGKEVAVVGGGNAAATDALHLAQHAKKVTIIHRRDSLRAEAILQERLSATPNISFLWNSAVVEVLGTAATEQAPKHMTHLRLRDLLTNDEGEVSFDGLFVAIGHEPQTKLFQGFVDLDERGYISTQPGTTRTSRPFVYAAGDVMDPIIQQAITAAAMGCRAALEATKDIQLDR